MPQTGMDWWVVAGVIVAIAGVWIAWRQLRKPKATTTNIAQGSERVRQSGGKGETNNEARDSSDIDQSGA